MRVTCSSLIDQHSPELIKRIRILGLRPIVTPILVRAVYDGDDHRLGQKLINLFEHEDNPDIYVDPFSIDVTEI